MKTPAKRALICISGLLFATQLLASQVGWTQINIAGTTPKAQKTAVALYYPTQADPIAIAMGPFMLNAAPQAVPESSFKGLILLSHGLGGSEYMHSSLAEALASHGYLVAALRHPGDNWQDSSLMDKTPERYFDERPRQVTHVINSLLLDSKWKDRIARDAQGPRIGAVGHSSGGYTVLALAGGEPALSRLAKHCKDEGADDPIFCGLRRSTQNAAPTTPSVTVSTPLRDKRVRAVVALAPVGAIFTPESLARIQASTAIYEAERDRFLVPRFHAEWIAQNMPRAELHRVPNAWHFAFVDTPLSPIPTPDGDIGANPPGFDRTSFLKKLGNDLSAFFDKTLQ